MWDEVSDESANSSNNTATAFSHLQANTDDLPADKQNACTSSLKILI